ncbi:hypothetical protein Pcinc_000103 [Petrolisthes cinctipes]|uniref:Uncharacterized protein n=1 Tax=Petrolisthes cinctipes TaxID=88211 RepID=A0AAE1L4N4_PETCI|nr:hypothetical protein Pcinc_000103 [Petrolisthes cinctipes]
MLETGVVQGIDIARTTESLTNSLGGGSTPRGDLEPELKGCRRSWKSLDNNQSPVYKQTLKGVKLKCKGDDRKIGNKKLP